MLRMSRDAERDVRSVRIPYKVPLGTLPFRVYKGLPRVPGGSVKGLQGTNDGMSVIN